MIAVITTILWLLAGSLLGLSLLGIWDSLTRLYTADLRPLLVALGIDNRAIKVYLRWWGIALFGSFFLLSVVWKMWPIAFAVFALLLLAPRWILQAMIARRQALLRDQLVGGTTALANACRAGLSLAVGLESVSREVPQPIATELQGIVSAYQHGRPLAEAITDTKDRLQLDSFTLFASAICVSLERGGRITESLERIARSLQENQRVERKLEAETASGKRVVWLLAAFPFVFLAGFYVLHPSGTSLVFQTLIGQFILLVVIALVVASVWWSNKILSIEL